MLTLEGLMAVLALAGTFYAIGYSVGYYHGRTQK